MKKIINLLLIIFALSISYSQGINNTWQLGNRTIKFDTNPPTITNTGVANQYGKASISDNNGNLLFYTDNEYIWDKNHMQLNKNPITFNLPSGNFKLESSSIFFPDILTPGEYILYTFNPNVYLPNNKYKNEANRIRLSFNDPSFPNGKVIDYGPIYDNGLLHNYKCQDCTLFTPMTIAKNEVNDSYNIILYHGLGRFDIYNNHNILTPSSTQVLENVDDWYREYRKPDQVNSGYSTAIIKVSPNNEKIGLLVKNYDYNYSTSTYVIHKQRFSTFDYNANTTTFSNFQIVQDNVSTSATIGNMIDFEFSSDSNLVYLLSDKVNVKNINNNSPFRVLSQTGSSNQPTNFFKIQRDKNGNILMSSKSPTNNQNLFLHSINNQNSFNASSVNMNFISLNGGQIDHLPILIPDLNNCPQILNMTTNVTSGQDNKQAEFTINALNTIMNGATAIYHAGNEVVLKPNFAAVGGSYFRAYNEGCSGVFVRNSMVNTSFSEISEMKIYQAKITIYPNPNNGLFNIRLPEQTSGQLEIYDMSGKLIHQKDFSELQDFEINIQGQSKGIYLLKVNTATGSLTEKLIKY